MTLRARNPRWSVPISLLALVVLAAGCTDGAADSTTTTGPPSTTTAAPATTTTTTTTAVTAPTEAPDAAPAVGTLSDWVGQQAMLTVPLDHDDPAGPTIEVPVTRAAATDPANRIGVLLVNPGGPGYPASPLALFADQVFTPELRARFDIIALDPRGTFPDTAVNCFTDLADLWAAADYSPDAPGELEALDAVVQAWVEDCADRYGDLLEHVSTMDTVNDMALLVAALGEQQVSYLGFSYGTALGSAFVTEYPDLVRAAVFDGAYLAYGDPLETMLDSFEAADALLVRIFEECDSSPDCPITGGAQEAFRRVAAQVDAQPAQGNPLLPTINEQAFASAIRFSEATYGGSAEPLLQAVADADAGDYFKLQSLVANAAALLEAGGAALPIACMDYPYRELVDMPDDALETLLAAAPTYTAVFPIPEGFDPFELPDDCTRWPVGPDPLPSPLSGEGAGPVLVVSATEDPVTPLASARKLAAELVNSTLLVVESPVHGSYQIDIPLRSEARRCATEAIDRFLIEIEVPPADTICEQ